MAGEVDGSADGASVLAVCCRDRDRHGRPVSRMVAVRQLIDILTNVAGTQRQTSAAGASRCCISGPAEAMYSPPPETPPPRRRLRHSMRPAFEQIDEAAGKARPGVAARSRRARDRARRR